MLSIFRIASPMRLPFSSADRLRWRGGSIMSRPIMPG